MKYSHNTWTKKGGRPLLIQKSAETDKEDIELTTKIFERFAINANSELSFSEVMEQSPGDLVNAINCL